MLVPFSVEELMTQDVATVGPAATVRAVAERLHGSDIGSLIVTDGDIPIGIVTERDLVGVLARGANPDETLIKAVMTSDVVTVAPEATIEQAAQLLEDGGFRRLPVVDEDQLVGIVTTTDLSAYLPRLSDRERRHAGNRATPSLPAVDDDRPVTPATESTMYDANTWEFEREGDGDLVVGDVVLFRKSLNDEDIEAFARATGDTNRLHLDDGFAAQTRFGGRIAHGTLAVGLISAALARLPGLTIYLGQDVRYLGPVRPDETVTAVCKVTETLGSDRYRLATTVYNDEDDPVVDGEATVLVDELPGDIERQVETSS